MRTPILIFATALLIGCASWLTFFDHNRYGTHGDGFKCGEVKDTVTSYTAATYYLFSHPSNGKPVKVGTCPYDNFKAKTYALDLWLPAILLGYVIYEKRHLPRRIRGA